MECVGVVNIYEKGPEARGGITKDKKRRQDAHAYMKTQKYATYAKEAYGSCENLWKKTQKCILGIGIVETHRGAWLK